MCVCVQPTHKGYIYLCLWYFTSFQYKQTKKTFWVDRHEDEDVVARRKDFVREMKEFEQRTPVFVRITFDTEKILAEGKMKYGGKEYFDKLDTSLGTRVYPETSNVVMVEYQVFDHPYLHDYALDQHEFGGQFRHGLPENERVLLLGQDECVLHQFTTHKKRWSGPDGQSALQPKNEGTGYHMSGIVGRMTGWLPTFTDEEIEKINEKRKGQEYVSADSAIIVNGDATKPQLKLKSKPSETGNAGSPFLRTMRIGVAYDGYWTSHHMSLQLEDLADCVAVKWPSMNVVLILDHSAGHTKARPDALSAISMNRGFGGLQSSMRPTKVPAVGPFPAAVAVGQVQQMVFSKQDTGPFWMSSAERLLCKYDRLVGEPIRKKKGAEQLRREILSELHTRNPENKALVKAVQQYKLGQLTKLAGRYSLSTIFEDSQKIPGWLGKPKGMLQVLWERGLINPNIPLQKYKIRGHKDATTGKIVEGTSLRELMQKQLDFQTERTYLQSLGRDIGIMVVHSPKVHPEIAGCGIETIWAVIKMRFRSQPIQDKMTGKAFIATAEDCASRDIISRRVVAGCYQKCRSYIEAYAAIHTEEKKKVGRKEGSYDGSNEEQRSKSDTAEPSESMYVKVEKLRKEKKTHRSDADLTSVVELQSIVNNK